MKVLAAKRRLAEAQARYEKAREKGGQAERDARSKLWYAQDQYEKIVGMPATNTMHHESMRAEEALKASGRRW